VLFDLQRQFGRNEINHFVIKDCSTLMHVFGVITYPYSNVIQFASIRITVCKVRIPVEGSAIISTVKLARQG
jgi:hypothetical protein